MLSRLWTREQVKRKRGGWRQQLEDSEPGEFDEIGMSRLAAGQSWNGAMATPLLFVWSIT